MTVEEATPPDPGNARLTVDTTTAAPGASVTVTLKDGSGGTRDWLALATVGDPANWYDAFTYVGDGVTTRDWTVTMPSTPDAYEALHFLHHGHTHLARSKTHPLEGVPPPHPGQPSPRD